MASGLTIEIHPAGDQTLVTIAGVVDENADMRALATVTGRVELDLAGVRRFNSVGVRTWVDALRALCARAQVHCVECSSSVVNQVNMISGFLGGGRIASFYAPMRCESCDREVDHLFDRERCEDGLPAVACASCGRALELDEPEDQYLLFLREPTRVA